MTQKQRGIFSIIFRFVALCEGIFGIIFHMRVNSMLDTGFMVKHNLAYFTLQTNIFSVLIFAILLIKSLKTLFKEKRAEVSHIDERVHLACTMYITITMIAYWLILTPMTGIAQNAILLCDSICLHAITPILAIADTFLFMEHGKVKKTDVPKFLIYPIAYYISVVVIAQFIKEPYYSFKMGGKVIELMYPYPFLDPSFMGVGGIAAMIAAALVIFSLFALLYITLDNKLTKRK